MSRGLQRLTSEGAGQTERADPERCQALEIRPRSAHGQGEPAGGALAGDESLRFNCSCKRRRLSESTFLESPTNSGGAAVASAPGSIRRNRSSTWLSRNANGWDSPGGPALDVEPA